MAPLKSSFNRSAGKLLGLFNQKDVGKDGVNGWEDTYAVVPMPVVYNETYMLVVAGGAGGGHFGGGFANSQGGGGGGGVLHNVGGSAFTVVKDQVYIFSYFDNENSVNRYYDLANYIANAES